MSLFGSSPTGIQMLLKTMGFDPTQVMGQITNAQNDVKKVVTAFSQILGVIQSDQKLILSNQEKILTLLQAQVPTRGLEPPSIPTLTEG